MQEDIRTVKSVITSTMYDYLGSSGLKLMDFAGNIIVGLLILLIGFRVIRYIIKLVDRILEKSKIDPTLHTFLLSFLRIAMKIMVILWAVAKVGVGTSSIIALLGSAGVAIGLSLQGSLANIAGGVILLFMKPFEVGDYILEDSSSKEGTVLSIGIMYTKLLSPETKTVLIPNGNLTNSSITNYTTQGRRRIKIQIGVEYDQDIAKVRKILEQVIEKEAARLPDAPVQIYLDEFKDSCICMGIHFWVRPEDYWESRWRVQEDIKSAFDKHSITVPFNRLDVALLKE